MKTKTILHLLIAVSMFGSIACKKEKTTVQTQLPSNYTNQGTITVESKNISICIYDNSAEDGDVVDLFFNGNALINNYEILNTEKCFNATLENGNNWIGINVDNEGINPPASVTVKINDGTSVQEFNIDGEVGAPGGYIIKL
jgi:hypothetical protein